MCCMVKTLLFYNMGVVHFSMYSAVYHVQLVLSLGFNGWLFFFLQKMRRPKFPAAFVFWLRLWMPGSMMMLLKHSAFVNLTLLLMW